MLRSLKYASFLLLFLLISCGKKYQSLAFKPLQAGVSISVFKPVFDKALYRCLVNGKFLFKSFHLSGILIFKTLPDSSTRAVFQNEMGLTFFDFSWDPQDTFQVLKIIPQLNKPALIRTLRKDLELVLMKNLNFNEAKIHAGEGVTVHRFELKNGFADYEIKDAGLRRIYVVGKRKVATISLGNRENKNSMPDSVFVRHHTANFTIELKKINPDAE